MVRAAVAEADWHHTDHAANWHSQARRAARQGIKLSEQLERFVSGFKVTPTPRLRWVLALSRGCQQPDGWPDKLRWERWQPQCERTFADAERFLRGELEDPCKGADLYGSPVLEADVRNMQTWLAAGRVVLVRCVRPTANVYARQVRRTVAP